MYRPDMGVDPSYEKCFLTYWLLSSNNRDRIGDGDQVPPLPPPPPPPPPNGPGGQPFVSPPPPHHKSNNGGQDQGDQDSKSPIPLNPGNTTHQVTQSWDTLDKNHGSSNSPRHAQSLALSDNFGDLSLKQHLQQHQHHQNGSSSAGSHGNFGVHGNPHHPNHQTNLGMSPDHLMTDKDRRHVCPHCYKGFRSRQQLNQHNLVHSGVRKYHCQYCERAFKQLSHLQQHHRIHTDDVQPRTRIDEEAERSDQESLDDVKPPLKTWIDEETDSSDPESSLGDDPDEMLFFRPDDVKPHHKTWIGEKADSSDPESSFGDDQDEMPFFRPDAVKPKIKPLEMPSTSGAVKSLPKIKPQVMPSTSGESKIAEHQMNMDESCQEMETDQKDKDKEKTVKFYLKAFILHIRKLLTESDVKKLIMCYGKFDTDQKTRLAQYSENKPFLEIFDEIIQLIRNMKNKHLKYIALAQAFEKIGHEKVHLILTGKAKPTNDTHRQLILHCGEAICQMMVVDQILPVLVMADVVCEEDREAIQIKLDTKGNWQAAFQLLFCLPNKKVEWFPTFNTILREHQHQDLAKLINHELNKMREDGKDITASMSFIPQLGMLTSHYVDKKFRQKCNGCSKTFKLKRSPRHCRRCGELFCLECLQYTRRLNQVAYPDPEGVRRKVCRICYNEDSEVLGHSRSLTNEFTEKRDMYKRERIDNQRTKSKTQTFWRDQLDMFAECRRLLDGFERNVGKSESKKTMQELRSVVAVPAWQKSQFWQVENVSSTCRQCEKSLDMSNPRRNCKVCSLVLCKKCSNKELLIFYDDESQSGPKFAKLALINVIGCPEKEPNFSLLLYVCTDCKSYIDEQQQANHSWYERLRDDSPLGEINTMDTMFVGLTNKITACLQKFEEQDIADNHKKTGNNELALLVIQLNEFYTLYKSLEKVLERTESPKQRIFVKNFTKCPEKEPNISLLLYVCTDCKSYIDEQQQANHSWYERLRDDSPLGEINTMDTMFVGLTNKITACLQKFEEQDIADNHKKTGNNELALLGIQLNEFYTLYTSLQKVLERTESPKQRIFVKNFTKGKYYFYMEANHEYLKLCKEE